MPNTTRQQIYYPDGATQFNPVQNLFSTMATSIDNAISRAGNTRVASSTARGTAFPLPVLGDSVYRTDMQWVEGYFTGLSAGTNGWYPTSGRMPTLDSGVAAGNSVAPGGFTAKTGMNQLADGATANHGGFAFSNETVSLPFTGRWAITSTVQFSGSATGATRAARFASGSRIYGSNIPRYSPSASAVQVDISAVLVVTAGETIQVQVSHDASVSLSITLPTFTATYLGPI